MYDETSTSSYRKYLLYKELNMALGELLFSLPAEKRKLFRKLERIEKKIINNKWSNIFNKKCLKNNMLPKYVNFF